MSRDEMVDIVNGVKDALGGLGSIGAENQVGTIKTLTTSIELLCDVVLELVVQKSQHARDVAEMMNPIRVSGEPRMTLAGAVADDDGMKGGD